MLSPWEIRALSSVTYLLRQALASVVFRRLVIKDDYVALSKAKAVTASPLWLENIVQIDFPNSPGAQVERTRKPLFGVIATATKIIVKSLSQMPRLQSITSPATLFSAEQMACVLQNPSLRIIGLHGSSIASIAPVELPTFTNIRHLVLENIKEWDNVPQLLSILAPVLLILELRRYLNPKPFTLPLCESLTSFTYESASAGYSLSADSLHSFISSCPKLSSVTLLVICPPSLSLDKFPALSMRHLHLHRDVLLTVHGSGRLPNVYSLRVSELDDLSNLPTVHFLAGRIRQHFPGLYRLELQVPWTYRHHALALARLIPSVRELHLLITTNQGFKNDECEPVGPWSIPRAIESQEHLIEEVNKEEQLGELERLSVEVTHISRPLDDSAQAFTEWWISLEQTKQYGLAGPHLRETDVTYFSPATNIREGDLRRWYHAQLEEGKWKFTFGSWYE